VGGRIAAPAAIAHYHRREVEVEGLPDAGLDTAIGGTAANDDRVAPQHVKELGDTRPVKGAGPALEEDVILRPRRDVVGEPSVRRALDSFVSGGTPVSAERSVGSMTTSVPSARLTGVV